MKPRFIFNEELIKTWKYRIRGALTTQKVIAKEARITTSNLNLILNDKATTNYLTIDRIEKVIQEKEKQVIKQRKDVHKLITKFLGNDQ